MVDLRVLDPTFTPQSHMRLEDVIWQLWGRWPLVKAQTAKMGKSDRKKLYETPYGLKGYEESAYNRFKTHFEQGKRNDLTVDDVIRELIKYKRIQAPQNPTERDILRKEIKKVRQRAYTEVFRANKKNGTKKEGGKK